MQKVSDIFALWPADVDLGRELGVPYSTVAAWKQRNSIPVAYWREIVRAARRRGRLEVTPDLLVDLHARASARPTGFAETEALYGDSAPSASSPGGGDTTASNSAGHFSRFKHLRRSHFASLDEINDHIRGLREEWDRR